MERRNAIGIGGGKLEEGKAASNGKQSKRVQ